MNRVKNWKIHDSQRGYFTFELYKHMLENEDIVLVTMDLGFGMFDAIRDDMPDRFYNVGASEQAGMGVAVGLALQGKIPVIYSITPFLIFRPYETIRNYIDHEEINVKLIGGGRDQDYSRDGFSHWADDVYSVMHNFLNIQSYYPETKQDIPNVVNEIFKSDKPSFLSLQR